MKNYKLSTLISGLSALLLLGSCQDEDFGVTAEDIKKSKFAQNFENQYGPISPDQSWDLTNYMTRTSKYNDEALVDYLLQNDGKTRAAGYYNPINETLPESLKGILLDDDGYYHVQENTIKWMRNYLKEGVKNTNLGSAFTLRAPGNQIAIIPIYQGYANMDWSLYIRHNGSDTKLWEESKDILVSNDGGTTWEEKTKEYGTSQTVYDKEIKAKPIIVDLGASEVKEFNLYLKVDKGLVKYDDEGNLVDKDSYAFDDAIQLSSMGMMLALPCPLPTNLGKTIVNGDPKQNLAMIVGCEDSDLAGSDWDMNDVCFLIVGLPALPNRIDITRKRYMCEDLGNTYDFDFNDIVVDVMEVQTSEYDAATNLFKPAGTPTQIATIKHVCGTLPFKVKVGDIWFNEVTDPTDEVKTRDELAADVSQSDIVNLQTRNVDWNPEFSRRITGWNHNTNNIEILVSTETNKNIDVLTDAFGDKNGAIEIDRDKHIYHITFAERGKAPLIIATDPTLMWMEEHQNIPESWWKEGTFKPTGNADNDAPADGGHTTDEWKQIPETLVKLDDAGNAVIWEAPEGFQGWGVWQGDDILTNFLDAVFEGYTTLEIEFASDNSAHQFRFIKVRDNWETYETVQITDGKFVHPFTGNITSQDEYYLGFAIMMDNSGGTLKPTRMIMKKPQTYTLTINNGDHGTVSVDVPANSDGKYPEGTVVTITATPDDGWYFDQWSNGSKTNPLTITISGDLELTPTYTDEAPSYVWAGPHKIESYGSNFKYEISATAEQGDKLIFNVSQKAEGDFEIIFDSSWSKKAKATWDEANGTYVLELTQDNASAMNQFGGILINANGTTVNTIDLVKPATYTINIATANAEQGSVEIVGKAGTSFTGSGTVQLKATPATGYKFASWTTPSGTSTDNPLSVTLSETVDEQTYIANFVEAAKYTITVTSGDNGSVDTEGGTYYEGTEVTLTASPADGYRVARWTKNDVIIDGATQNTLTITVSGNDTYGVEFEEKPAGPVEIELSYSEKKLYLETITNAEANDNDIIRFYITNNSGENRNGWGIGEIQDMNWSKQADSWTGKEGSEWTYEYTVSQVKTFANGTTGIQYSI